MEGAGGRFDRGDGCAVGAEREQGEAGAEGLEDVSAVRERQGRQVVAGDSGEGWLAVDAGLLSRASEDDRRALVVGVVGALARVGGSLEVLPVFEPAMGRSGSGQP